MNKFHTHVKSYRRQCDIKCRTDKLRTLGKLPQAVDGHHARHKLCGDELVGVFQGYGTDEHRSHVSHKSRPGIHEHPDENRSHGERDDVDIEQVMLDEE